MHTTLVCYARGKEEATPTPGVWDSLRAVGASPPKKFAKIEFPGPLYLNRIRPLCP